MTNRHWTPSCQLQPATTLKVWNPSPSNWQHRYLTVSSLQKSKLQPWGICIYYKTPHSLMIKWYCGGMARRPLRNLPVCSTLHCAELGHSASVAFPRTDRPPIGYEQLFICIYTYHICICVCMYVCMYVCILYVCMYISEHIYSLSELHIYSSLPFVFILFVSGLTFISERHSNFRFLFTTLWQHPQICETWLLQIDGWNFSCL